MSVCECIKENKRKRKTWKCTVHGIIVYRLTTGKPTPLERTRLVHICCAFAYYVTYYYCYYLYFSIDDEMKIKNVYELTTKKKDCKNREKIENSLIGEIKPSI